MAATDSCQEIDERKDSSATKSQTSQHDIDTSPKGLL